MGEYTKKQLAAIKNIIAVENRRCHKSVQIGLVKDYGYSVHGAHICCHAPEGYEIPGTLSDMRVTRSIFEFIRGNWENGYYYMVEEPFDGKVALSKLRKQLNDNTLTLQNGARRIMLYASCHIDGIERKIKGLFNVDYIKYALESVGKNPAIFIGFQNDEQRQGVPSCIVVGGGGMKPLEKVCSAMVAGCVLKDGGD